MPRITPDQIKHNTELLIEASKQGDVDEVKRLIPVSNPQENYSEALCNAAEYGHIECIILLIPVSDYNLILKFIKLYQWDTTLLEQGISEHEAILQKERISNALNETSDFQRILTTRKI